MADLLAADQVEALLAAYEREGRRLAAAATGVELVRDALAGRRFRAKL
jgi:hypothetical protein